jgi:hypothetical protein
VEELVENALVAFARHFELGRFGIAKREAGKKFEVDEESGGCWKGLGK